jgi:Peptidase M15
MSPPNQSRAYGMRSALRLLGIFCAVLLASCKPANPPPPTITQVRALPVTGNQARTTTEFPADFSIWLQENPASVVQIEALKAYLAREGVADVLPIWQLVQTETPQAAAQCQISGYAIPPQEMWPTIVPTLRLIRQEIVPLLGPVQVLSSFRTNEANRCSEGAPQSPHKRYSALDLAMVSPIPQKEMFAKLCKHWYGLSPRWAYGLGAYYVRGYAAYNQEGRFHVDTLGRRTWGHSYGAYTSHCRELGYIQVKSPEQIKAEEEAKLKAEADALAKTEAEAKAKVDADRIAKAEAESTAKAKAKEDLRLQALATANLTKANADAVPPVKIIAGKPENSQPTSPDQSKND